MRIAGTVKESVVDGPDIRYTIFTQGCEHNCFGCHNKGTHDINGGYEITVEELISDIDNYSRMGKNVTISGGDPFIQLSELFSLVSKLRVMGYNIWIYTGYTIEELTSDIHKKILSNIDVLVDGRFDISKKDLSLKFRGSSNQRLIDVQATILSGEVIIYE